METPIGYILSSIAPLLLFYSGVKAIITQKATFGYFRFFGAKKNFWSIFAQYKGKKAVVIGIFLIVGSIIFEVFIQFVYSVYLPEPREYVFNLLKK